MALRNPRTVKVRSCTLNQQITIQDLIPSIASSFWESQGPDDFKVEYLISSLMEKYDGTRDSLSAEEREHAAIQKMLACEVSCRGINSRDLTPLNTLDAEFVGTVINRAHDICAEVLGPFTYNVFSTSRFSGGASTSKPRRLGDPFFKYKASLGIDVTARAFPYARALIDCTPLWRDANPTIRIVAGNRVTTVPKNSQTDRPIAIEPDLNMALQKSVGDHIRSRLKAVGINLNKQEINRDLARKGSLDGSLATIDLSSASDMISTAVVKRLLPFDWYACLDDIRCHSGKLYDDVIHWEKFSAMGNGFTFELESLIFYSLVKATIEYDHSVASLDQLHLVNGRDLSVYGDDIIIPTEYYDPVSYILSHMGFQLNQSKSFHTGPFRESCGGHYYEGVDVTPIYLRCAIDSLPDLIGFLNKFRRWCSTTGGVCDPRGWPIWRLLSKQVPKDLKGGRALDVSSALATPGKSQSSLTLVSKSRRINGVPAVLRWFQGRVRDSDDQGLCFVSHEMSIRPDARPQEITTEIVHSLYRVRPNKERWLELPLFSNEIM